MHTYAEEHQLGEMGEISWNTQKIKIGNSSLLEETLQHSEMGSIYMYDWSIKLAIFGVVC